MESGGSPKFLSVENYTRQRLLKCWFLGIIFIIFVIQCIQSGVRKGADHLTE